MPGLGRFAKKRTVESSDAASTGTGSQNHPPSDATAAAAPSTPPTTTTDASNDGHGHNHHDDHMNHMFASFDDNPTGGESGFDDDFSMDYQDFCDGGVDDGSGIGFDVRAMNFDSFGTNFETIDASNGDAGDNGNVHVGDDTNVHNGSGGMGDIKEKKTSLNNATNTQTPSASGNNGGGGGGGILSRFRKKKHDVTAEAEASSSVVSAPTSTTVTTVDDSNPTIPPTPNPELTTGDTGATTTDHTEPRSMNITTTNSTAERIDSKSSNAMAGEEKIISDKKTLDQDPTTFDANSTTEYGSIPDTRGACSSGPPSSSPLVEEGTPLRHDRTEKSNADHDVMDLDVSPPPHSSSGADVGSGVVAPLTSVTTTNTATILEGAMELEGSVLGNKGDSEHEDENTRGQEGIPREEQDDSSVCRHGTETNVHGNDAKDNDSGASDDDPTTCSPPPSDESGDLNSKVLLMGNSTQQQSVGEESSLPSSSSNKNPVTPPTRPSTILPELSSNKNLSVVNVTAASTSGDGGSTLKHAPFLENIQNHHPSPMSPPPPTAVATVSNPVQHDLQRMESSSPPAPSVATANSKSGEPVTTLLPSPPRGTSSTTTMKGGQFKSMTDSSKAHASGDYNHDRTAGKGRGEFSMTNSRQVRPLTSSKNSTNNSNDRLMVQSSRSTPVVVTRNSKKERSMTVGRPSMAAAGGVTSKQKNQSKSFLLPNKAAIKGNANTNIHDKGNITNHGQLQHSVGPEGNAVSNPRQNTTRPVSYPMTTNYGSSSSVRTTSTTRTNSDNDQRSLSVTTKNAMPQNKRQPNQIVSTRPSNNNANMSHKSNSSRPGGHPNVPPSDQHRVVPTAASNRTKTTSQVLKTSNQSAPSSTRDNPTMRNRTIEDRTENRVIPTPTQMKLNHVQKNSNGRSNNTPVAHDTPMQKMGKKNELVENRNAHIHAPTPTPTPTPPPMRVIPIQQTPVAKRMRPSSQTIAPSCNAQINPVTPSPTSASSRKVISSTNPSDSSRVLPPPTKRNHNTSLAPSVSPQIESLGAPKSQTSTKRRETTASAIAIATVTATATTTMHGRNQGQSTDPRKEKSFDDLLSQFNEDLIESSDIWDRCDTDLVELQTMLCITSSIALRLQGEYDDLLDEVESVLLADSN